jgi:hypothetical protein
MGKVVVSVGEEILPDDSYGRDDDEGTDGGDDDHDDSRPGPWGRVF